jgi:AcrR family transcriptional regulator
MNDILHSAPPAVKPARVYDSSGRRERARAQHAAALDAAHRSFLENGFAATTVASIAEASGVSAATIYKSYGGKTGMLRELCRRALEGSGRVPAERRSNALRSMKDPREVIAGWGRLVAEVSPLISPLLLLLRAAADADQDAATLYEELDAARLARMADNASSLAEMGHLRDGITVADARDILWTSSSPELYDLLVRRRGWSVARYAGFVAAMLADALL